MNLVPPAALMYRRGDARPAIQAIELRQTVTETFMSIKNFDWNEGYHIQGNLSPAWCLIHRIERETFDSPESTRYSYGTPLHPYTSDTGELTWNTDDGIFTINTLLTQGVTGWIGGDTLDLANMTIASNSSFATIVLTSLDSLSIANSKRLLLSSVSRAENEGMIWNNDSTSVSNDWGTAPALMQPIEASIELTFNEADDIIDFSLSPTGENVSWITSNRDSIGHFHFEIDGVHETPWYGIEVIREKQPDKKGDVNGDGNINILDVVLTISFILETSAPTPEQFWAADMNEDSNIDILDVLEIVIIILGSK